jgi:hypothetical protein
MVSNSLENKKALALFRRKHWRYSPKNSRIKALLWQKTLASSSQHCTITAAVKFVAVAIANTLAQNGYDVTLFTTKPVDPKSSQRLFRRNLASKN